MFAQSCSPLFTIFSLVVHGYYAFLLVRSTLLNAINVIRFRVQQCAFSAPQGMRSKLSK